MQVRLLSSPPFSFLDPVPFETNLIFSASTPAMRRFKSTVTKLLQLIFAVGFLTILSVISIKPQSLETREIDLKGCIQMSFGQELIIKDRQTFLKTIRSDFSRAACLKNLEKIDFNKYTLLGIELNTGYCRRPLGLKSEAIKNEAEKQIILEIRYVEPQGTCRALSQYAYWVLVPKLFENYTVKFDIKPGSY